MNDIVLAVAAALDERFPQIRVFSKETAQGLDPPAFFVETAQVAARRLPFRRIGKEYRATVHYFPANAQNHDEMRDMGEAVIETLEIIGLPGGIKTRGLKRSWNIRPQEQKNILYCHATYKVVEMTAETAELMKEQKTIFRG
jgi:hypothetical protein